MNWILMLLLSRNTQNIMTLNINRSIKTKLALFTHFSIISFSIATLSGYVGRNNVKQIGINMVVKKKQS